MPQSGSNSPPEAPLEPMGDSGSPSKGNLRPKKQPAKKKDKEAPNLAGAGAGSVSQSPAPTGEAGFRSLPGSRGRSPTGSKEGNASSQDWRGSGGVSGQVEQAARSEPSDLLSYDADQLKGLSEHPMAQEWPTVLEEQFRNERGRWDPDHWHQATRVNRGGPEGRGAPAANKAEDLAANDGKVRRTGKDRLKAEHNNDLVLSPQRRSFLGGCQAPAEAEEQDQEEGPPFGSRAAGLKEQAAAANRNRRGVTTGGSGRIVNRNNEIEPKGGADKSCFDQFASANSRRDRNSEKPSLEPFQPRRREDWDLRGDKDRGDRVDGDPARRREDWHQRGDRDRKPLEQDRFSNGGRRGFGEARGPTARLANNPFEGRREREDYDRGGGYGNNRRRNAQPEWMDEEIDQQGELMELGGFEDAEAELRNRNHRAKEKEKLERESKKQQQQQTEPPADFNLEDFLRNESIDKILASSDTKNGCEAPEASAANSSSMANESRGSRFSQFFNSGRSAADGNEKQLPSQLEVETNHSKSPSADEKEKFYFAPISPAATTTVGSPLKPGENVMEDLQRQLERTLGEPKAPGQFGSHFKEARQEPKNQGPEMSPFEKFAALMGSQDSPSEEAHARPNEGIPIHSANKHHPDPVVLKPRVPPGNPNVMYQASDLAPPAPPPMQQMPDLLELIWHHQDQPELLELPEAYVIKCALANGDLTPLAILNQFANCSDGLQPVQKDILVNFIKLFQRERRLPKSMTSEIYHMIHHDASKPSGMAPRMNHRPPPSFPGRDHRKYTADVDLVDPAIISSHGHGPPLPPPMTLPEHNPSWAPPGHAPPMHPALLPSAIESAPHMQPQIPPPQMQQQNLLVKKKHEEKENLRKVRGGGPEEASPRDKGNVLGHGFTPTVVIKKLVADRRDSEPKVLPEELRDAFTAPASNIPAGLPLSDLVGGGMPGFGGDLSKFFAPHLLAQATAGQAPVMPPLPKQKALTLEELEHQEETLKV